MNSWTQLLTPTKLEKTFANKPVGGKPSNKPKSIEIRTPSGEIKRFNSTVQAARDMGASRITIARLCQEQQTDRHGNQYRYI